MDEPKLYSLDEIAEIFDVTTRTVRNYVNAGLISVIPWPKRSFVVTEEELRRIKSEGLNTHHLTKKGERHEKNKPNAVRSKSKERTPRRRG